jgi:hypothetical protein
VEVAIQTLLPLRSTWIYPLLRKLRSKHLLPLRSIWIYPLLRKLRSKHLLPLRSTWIYPLLRKLWSKHLLQLRSIWIYPLLRELRSKHLIPLRSIWIYPLPRKLRSKHLRFLKTCWSLRYLEKEYSLWRVSWIFCHYSWQLSSNCLAAEVQNTNSTEDTVCWPAYWVNDLLIHSLGMLCISQLY